MASTNPVTNDTTDVVSVTSTDAGDHYLTLRFTVAAGTGPTPLAAGVYEAILPANGISFKRVS